VTTDEGPDVQPAWSPDGERIAFAAFRNDRRDIYVVNSDGTDLVRLTFDGEENTALAP
jgi:TolB protein